MEKVKVKLLNGAEMPKYETAGAAAFDLCANEEVIIRNVNAQERAVLVPTGVCVEIPKGYYGLLTLRSSTGVKTKLRMSNHVGIIDSDYRGEIKIPLEMNTRGGVYTTYKGERLAQLLILPVQQVSLVEVKELGNTKRGDGGFGSTNKPLKSRTGARKVADKEAVE